MLRLKLTKLKEDIGSFHDTSAKQRQNLVEECKEIRMTTGGSPVPKEFQSDDTFDISNRVQRPWAYSVMETTYNKLYKDAVIPVPKKHRRKSESDRFTTPRTPSSSRSMFDTRSSLGSRVLSSKSHDSSGRSFVTSSSDGASKSLEPTLRVDCPQRQSSSHSSRHDIDKVPVQYTSEAKHELEYVKSGKQEKRAQFKTIPNVSVDYVDDKENTSMVVENTAADKPSSADTRTSSSEVNPRNLFVKPNDSDRKLFGAPISLPPAYKIDSKVYQDAERSRAINRSRSRVSFSGGPQMLSEANVVKEIKQQKPLTPEKQSQNTDKRMRDSPTNTDITTIEKQTAESPSRTVVNILTLDPETMHDVKLRHIDDVMYKGKKIKNYIRPDERYKIDPIVMQRRQQKMDHLAKESITYLKRVNHENINVDIAFPRSARRRILTRLVKENNSKKSRKVCDDSTVEMRRKIDYFMESVSEYIRKQKLEREQTF